MLGHTTRHSRLWKPALSLLGWKFPTVFPFLFFAGQHHQQPAVVEVIPPWGLSAPGSAPGHVALGGISHIPGDKRGVAVTPPCVGGSLFQGDQSPPRLGLEQGCLQGRCDGKGGKR